MKFKTYPRPPRPDRRPRAAFTFAEVLAALLFMAIVIPTAVEGVRIANLAGQLSIRKTVATRIAQNCLNEIKVTRQWQRGNSNGTLQEGAVQYHWNAQVESWAQINRPPSSLRLLTVRVHFLLQGREYDVRVSTLVDASVT